jgi:hypothetical protein
MPFRLVSFLLLMAASVVHAQDKYLLPERFVLKPGETVLIGLHSGDFFPGSEYSIPPEKLVRGRLSTGGTVRQWKDEGERTVATITAPARAGSFSVGVETAPEARELEADDFEAYLADEGANDTLLWRSRQGEARRTGRELIRRSAKTLLSVEKPGPGFDRPLGHPLEIVPLKNAAALEPGDALTVRVLFRGAPLRGALINVRWVYADGRMGSLAAGPTDVRGLATLRIEAAGRWKLHTLRLVRRLDRREADWDTYTASLTFETGGMRGPGAAKRTGCQARPLSVAD